jgi:multiple antibiotic resistance protein
LGKLIFEMFGITLPALRIIGGFLVVTIGLDMLKGKTSHAHNQNEGTEKDNDNDTSITITPLAFPLLAGPGVIATAMNFSAKGTWLEIITTIATFACLCLITFVCFIFSKQIIKGVGESGLIIITRLMGLILAVIGMQLIISGVFAAIVLNNAQ